MIRRKSNVAEPDVPPSIEPEKGIELLNKQKAKLAELAKGKPIDKSGHSAWGNTTRDYLVKIFGSTSANINEVLYASSDVSMHMDMEDYELEAYYQSQMRNQGKMLDSCVEQLETEIALHSSKSTYQPNKESPIGNKVFIVHGHNSTAKESLARLIAKLGLTPVILHEQPNIGRTLIEKFTDYSDVSFAVVVLTADDVGVSKERKDNLQPRARQNVVFELGFFIGKLGRARVCVLYEVGVELPSDYDGVVYVQLDTKEKWKHDLLKELKASGFDIDANVLYE